MARQIHEVIFFGNPGASDAVRVVQRRLQEALENLSGLQQPDHPTSEADAIACQEEREIGAQDLMDAGVDIMVALGLESLLHPSVKC